MCGLAGSIGKKQFSQKKKIEILSLMTKRGPDHQNTKSFKNRSDSLFFQGTAHGLRKSLIINLSNNSKINIKVQGNGWEINNKNKMINNSIKNSINYYLNPPSEIFNKSEF